MKSKNPFPRGSSTGLKFLIVTFLVLIFLIPLLFIQKLISNRSYHQNAVQREIVNSWGGENFLAGPYLIIPFIENQKFYDEEGKVYREKELRREWIQLPETLSTAVNNTTELRSRGIYSVPVFLNDIAMEGHFDLTESVRALDDKRVLWEEVRLAYSMPSLRALSSLSEVQAGTEILEFAPGSPVSALLGQQIEASWEGLTGEETALPFRFTMELKGGNSLQFLPLAKDTEVSLVSDWPAPSFIGAYLPMEREFGAKGTTALWRINYLSRNFPQGWTVSNEQDSSYYESAFGLTMMEPVTSYTKNTRTAKYGLLFLIIPFSVFFFFEVITSRRIHPIQYLIAGLGNVVFYLLLLSLSEHIGFNGAYLASMVGVIGLVTFYARSILGTESRGWIMAPILAVCYGYLFVVLQSEDYALLLGSLGLFVLIGMMMFLSRRINWYGTDQPAPDQKER